MGVHRIYADAVILVFALCMFDVDLYGGFTMNRICSMGATHLIPRCSIFRHVQIYHYLDVS